MARTYVAIVRKAKKRAMNRASLMNQGCGRLRMYPIAKIPRKGVAMSV